MSKAFLDAKQIMGTIDAAAKKGLAEAAMAIEATAVERAPFRDGYLRNSALIAYPLQDDGLRAIIAFNIVYAAYQHEGDFAHPGGGQKHYLKSAMDDRAEKTKAIIANHLKGVL